jgi:nucleotide-binding universal stress UspA family protein
MSDESAMSGTGSGFSGEVAVGFDGSRNAALAVRWAASEASRRGSSLQVISSGYHPGMPSWVGVAAAPLPTSIELATQERAAEGRRIAASVLPDDRIETHAVSSGAATALVEASTSAGLVVVGHRGHGAFATALLGSVSAAVVRDAACPVVVVRGSVDVALSNQPVTVGVDGTKESMPALLFAGEIAARDASPLRVICAWQTLMQTGWEFANWQPEAVDAWARGLGRSARRAADAALDEIHDRWPQLDVEATVVEEAPALALEDASRASRLLVVGSHSAGGFGRFALGSVSHTVLHHSACPVAVVRPVER